MRRCCFIYILFLLIFSTKSYPQTRILEVQTITKTNETITRTLEENGSTMDHGMDMATNNERQHLSKPVPANIPSGTSMTNNIILNNTTNKNFPGHKKVPRNNLKILNKVIFPDRENERPVVYQSSISDRHHWNNDRKTDDFTIIFPEDNKPKPINFIPIKKPKCAEKNSYCTVVEDYPLNFVKDLANRRAIKEFGLFGTDVLPIFNISQRIDEVGDEPLCSSHEEVIFPQAAQNKDDKWLFVFNDNEQFVQGVRIEKCIQPEKSPCKIVNPVSGYQFECKQKYIYRKLVAIGDEGNTFVDSFRLPSCCSCYAKRDNGRAKRWY